MGRKKVLGANEAPELLECAPFCYYCDREFDDVKTLIQHQRTKHFCCEECGRTFSSVTSLRVHMLNSYKKSLKEVPHALSGRENPDIVVHGMEGLPQDILEERIQKSKPDVDSNKREEEKEQPKGAAKGDPSSPRTKSAPPMQNSPEPPSGQKQVKPAAPPDASGGQTHDFSGEPQMLEEEVDAALASLPPALKLLAPELQTEPGDMHRCEGLPDALASLHTLAVQALASFGLLQPGSYSANKMDAALQAAVAAVKQPKQMQPAADLPKNAAGGGATMPLPVNFMQAPMVAGPVTASQPRPLGPAQMGCFPAQFPLQGHMAGMPTLGRPPAVTSAVHAHPQGYVSSPQGIACGGCATQPMQLPFGVQPMAMGTMPTVGARPPLGGPPTMPLAAGLSLQTQLPPTATVEPAEKRAKMDVT